MKYATKILLTVLVLALAGSTAVADFGYRDKFAPGWESATGYTVQDWGLHDLGWDPVEEEWIGPGQPLPADNGYTNSYGTPTCVWDTQTPQGYYGWNGGPPMPPGTHPAWADDTWGGMIQMSGDGSAALTATVNPGAENGVLRIWVEYDWFASGNVSAGIAGATDITPATYYNHQLGTGGSSGSPWYRTIKVFEFTENPDTPFNVVFTATGFAPMMDSFEISTAIGAAVPPDMPVPEPATMVLLGLGGVGVLMRRRRRG